MHLTHQQLAALAAGHTPDGVARVEGVGAVLFRQACGWLSGTEVIMRPVLDIDGIAPVDCYEAPADIAEALRVRTPADPFPYSPNTTGDGDNDHNQPYVPPDEGGPPGQTAVHTMAWMTRQSHRIKTHGGWKVTQPRSGTWIWRSPHGHHYLIDHTGTTPLGKLT